MIDKRLARPALPVRTSVLYHTDRSHTTLSHCIYHLPTRRCSSLLTTTLLTPLLAPKPDSGIQLCDQVLDTNEHSRHLSARRARDLYMQLQCRLLVPGLNGPHQVLQTAKHLLGDHAVVEVVEQRVQATLRVVHHALLGGWGSRLYSSQLAGEGGEDAAVSLGDVGSVSRWVLELGCPRPAACGCV